jgi:hypothetical protein
MSVVSSHGRAYCILAGRLLPECGVLLGVSSDPAECMSRRRGWVTRVVPAGLYPKGQRLGKGHRLDVDVLALVNIGHDFVVIEPNAHDPAGRLSMDS